MNKTAIASLIGLLFTAPSFAQEITTKTEEVIVSATRFSENNPTVPANITVISKEDIQNTPAISIPDLLKTQAGINVSSFYGNQGIDSTVDIRSFGESSLNNTLILLDGQRLNPVDGSSIQWAAIPLQSLERIEIIRGSGSVLYGDRASGGVINLITDKSPRSSASLAATVGSYDHSGLDGSVLIRGERGYLNNYLHTSDSNGYRENSRSNQLSLSGRAGLFLGAHEAFVDYSVFRVANGLPSSIDSATFRDKPKTARTPDDKQKKEGFRVRPGVSINLSDTLKFDAEVALSDENIYFDNVSFGSTSKRDLETLSFTPRISWEHGIASLKSKTIAGFDYYNGRVKAVSTFSSQQKAQQVSQALYVQNVTALTEKLSSTLGIRTQNMDQDISQAPDLFNPAVQGSSDRTRTVYDAGLSYQVNDEWTTFAKIGTSFRFASTDELFAFDPITWAPVFAGDLKPQFARNKEIGLRYNNQRFDAKLALFHSKIDDEIGFNGAENANFDPTRRQGIETEFGWAINEQLRTKLAYAYTDAKLRAGANNGNRIPIAPSSTANAQFIWQTPNYGSYILQANYVGTRYTSGDFSNTLEKLPSHTTFDLRANWDFNPIKVSLNALNIFDKRYSNFAVFSAGRNDYFFFPADGRSFYLTAQYDFK